MSVLPANFRPTWRIEKNGDPFASRWRRWVAWDRRTGCVIAYGESYHAADLAAHERATTEEGNQ